LPLWWRSVCWHACAATSHTFTVWSAARQEYVYVCVCVSVCMCVHGKGSMCVFV
jgi:hypothetical protein